MTEPLALIDALPATGVLIRYKDGPLESVNAVARQWWPGIDRFIGDRWEHAAAWLARHCGQRERVFAALTTDRVRTSALEIPAIRGAIGPAMLLAYRQRLTTGQLVWVFHDASLLAASMRQVQAQGARLTAIMEHSPIPIRGYDMFRRVIHWNKAAEHLYGYGVEEVRGQQFEQDLMPADRRDFEATVMQSLIDGETDDPQAEAEFVRSDGQRITVHTSRVVVRDLPDGPEVYCLDVDLTQRVQRERKARALAFHDALTGLPNRAALEKRLDQLLQAEDVPIFSLCFMDLNGFKAVNDTHGHAIGDRLLTVVARRLKHGLREGDRLFRLGGDEFVILLPNTDRLDAHSVMQRFHAAFELPLQIENLQLRVGLSIGLSVWPDDGQDASALLGLADERMYEQKRERKAREALMAQSAKDGAPDPHPDPSFNGQNQRRVRPRAA